MKNILFAFVLIGLSVSAFAQSGPPAGDAKVGEFYGQDVSAKAIKKAISADELNKELKSTPKIAKTSVKGKVTAVCPKKGCWVSLATDSGETFFVKMKDYAFFVPTTLEGKTVVMEGSAESKTTSVKELQHYAEDAKKPQAEIDAITETKTETRFLASAIKVVE